MCSDPTATVRGTNVLAIVEAFSLADNARRLLEHHGVYAEDLEANRRVALQRFLDALREIAQQVGPAKLRAVGSKIIETALFPPQYPTVTSVLLALDRIYYLNHTGAVGHYVCRALADGVVEVGCETPYPRDFERGLVEGIARNPHLTGGVLHQVRYEEGAPGAERTCTITVTALARKP